MRLDEDPERDRPLERGVLVLDLDRKFLRGRGEEVDRERERWRRRLLRVGDCDESLADS